MQQFSDFRAGDMRPFPTCSKGCSSSHWKRRPSTGGWCAEPCVCNPPKRAVWLPLLPGSSHTPGSEWAQGRAPAGLGGGTLPWSLQPTCLREQGWTRPCQGGWCLGAAKGHREHPAASPLASTFLSALCAHSQPQIHSTCRQKQ